MARQQVELTDKKWKGMSVIGALLCVAGVGACVASQPGASVGLFVVGAVVTTVSRLGAWWTNG